MLDKLNKCILSLQYNAEIKCIINKNKERARWYNWDMVTSFEDWGETNPLSKEWFYLLLASAICLFSVYAYKYKKYTQIQKTKKGNPNTKTSQVVESALHLSPSIFIHWPEDIRVLYNLYTIYIHCVLYNMYTIHTLTSKYPSCTSSMYMSPKVLHCRVYATCLMSSL